jgi:hypothetical protein
MSYQHTVLDFYDDGGTLLRDLVPREHLPDFVKSATVLRGQTNNNQYALVLVEDGNTLAKFATADPGNAWISAAYFAKTRHLLPIEAQKTAAANIRDALTHFGIEVPSVLSKVAGEFTSDSNLVNVTGKSAPRIVRDEPKDIDYALELADGSKRYPLDNAESVKTALSYFELNQGQFIPRQRREYAVKVASVARKHGMKLNDSISTYAGEGYSPSLTGHLRIRADYISEDAMPELNKLAASRAHLAPEDFAEQLNVFDRSHGLNEYWDRNLLDPWRSTFSPLEKIAKGAIETHTFQIGNDVVTEQDLMNLKKVNSALISSFGHEFAMKYNADPVTFFSALPLPQKKVVAAMARDVSSHGIH